MQNEAKFLTITQAAQFLKISPDTLRRWEEKGMLTPQRTKGGSRRYTYLDLKIAKLNKRKSRLLQISTLIRTNYISSGRDLKIAAFTSFLWIFGMLLYHFLSPVFLMPTNPNQQILSDQPKDQTQLKIASEIISTRVDLAGKLMPEISIGSDLLIDRSSNLPNIEYSNSPDKYYSLEPLPKNQVPTLIKRI